MSRSAVATVNLKNCAITVWTIFNNQPTVYQFEYTKKLTIDNSKELQS